MPSWIRPSFIAKRGKSDDSATVTIRTSDETFVSQGQEVIAIPLGEWRQTEGREFRIISSRIPRPLLERMRKSQQRLEHVATVHLGMVLESHDLLRSAKTKNASDAIVLGRDIQRYAPVIPKNWFSFADDPVVGGTKNPAVYNAGPRVVVQAIRNLKLPRRLVASVVPAGIYTIGTVHNVIVRDPTADYRYVLGLMNSRLMNEFYAGSYPEHRIKGFYLESLPLPPTTAAQRDQLVALVTTILSLHTRIAAEKLPQRRDQLQREIDATDRQIDQIVYQLYGLTDDEIAVVEAATNPSTRADP